MPSINKNAIKSYLTVYGRQPITQRLNGSLKINYRIKNNKTISCALCVMTGAESKINVLNYGKSRYTCTMAEVHDICIKVMNIENQ